jgi:hypothetical protein
MPKQGDKTIHPRDPGAGHLKEKYSELSNSRSVWRAVGDALYRDDQKRSTLEQAKNHTRAKNASVLFSVGDLPFAALVPPTVVIPYSNTAPS